MKGILFNQETGMLKAVIDGKKTMTRRLGSLEDVSHSDWVYEKRIEVKYYKKSTGFTYKHDFIFKNDTNGNTLQIKSKYQEGETIYVKESYCDTGKIFYKIDFGKYEPVRDGYKWSNPMFCGEKVARHFLKIKNVKVERLQDISEMDCLDEGIPIIGMDEATSMMQYKRYDNKEITLSPQTAFASLIDKINGKGTWKSNPWVFVYEFEKLTNQPK